MSLFFIPTDTLRAQVTLDGVWEGTITIGGIYSRHEMPMQLYVTIDGRRIQGRSYVTIKEGETVMMELSGRLYHDQSMELVEIKFVGDEANEYFPKFSRQYQLVWKPDLWDNALTGFWQEKTEQTFYNYRERGRIKLKKRKEKGV